MKNIFQSDTLTDAALARNLLMENGIDVTLIEGRSPYPSATHSEVWVKNVEDEDRAIQLIRTLYAEPADDQQSWRCRDCKEDNPAAFELCWSCGTTHTAAR